VVQGQLDSVNPTTTEEGELIKIGPTPKFELINQDSKKVTETYNVKYMFGVFLSTCPTIVRR
jgi:protein SCO1/2